MRERSIRKARGTIHASSILRRAEKDTWPSSLNAPVHLLLARDRDHLRPFFRREKPLGKVAHVRQRPHLFDIDPNIALASKRKKGQTLPNGKFETKGRVSADGWFP